MFDYLKEEGVPESLLRAVEEFRRNYAVAEGLQRPRFTYYGEKIWEEAICSLLAGQNLLLSGPKATGKNVLAENLSFLFGR